MSIDWDDLAHWGTAGHNVHVGTSVDDAHDDDRYEAEVAVHAQGRVERS